MSRGILTITKDTFEAEVLRSSLPVLVDFWAPWCGPCNMMSPILDELAGEYTGRIRIAKINVDAEASLAEQHTIITIPTLILYNNGKILRKRSGAMPKTQLEELFKDLL